MMLKHLSLSYIQINRIELLGLKHVSCKCFIYDEFSSDSSVLLFKYCCDKTIQAAQFCRNIVQELTRSSAASNDLQVLLKIIPQVNIVAQLTSCPLTLSILACGQPQASLFLPLISCCPECLVDAAL